MEFKWGQMVPAMLLEQSLNGIMVHISILSKGFILFRQKTFVGQYECLLMLKVIRIIFAVLSKG